MLEAETLQTVTVMAIVVQKYGGTSVGDVDRIKQVADRIAATRDAGHQVVAVVSAMGQTTDDLVSLAAQVTATPPPREMDMLLTAGERVSMALLAMALEVRGNPAVSYTGSQAGILTDSSHGEARITEITGERVKESLSDGKVVIVAGFQGVDPFRKEITTLGRGGSDTTAVALAATLRADLCEINTDVDGVLSADPRVVPDARALPEIGYHEMYELASAGAAILAPHCVEFAHANHVPIHVRESFGEGAGTRVTAEAKPHAIAAIAHRTVDGQGILTVVGGSAGDAVEHLAASLTDSGLNAVIGDIGPISATLTIPADQLVEAVRHAHSLLSPPVATLEVPA